MSSRKDYDWFLRRGIITDECIGYFLQTAAGYWPEREMVCFEDRRYSYRDVYRWSVAMALILAENGVCPGDKVLIQVVNSVDILAIQFAAWRIGAITVPIVPMYRGHELRSIIGDVRPRVVVASGQVGSRDYGGELDETLKSVEHAPTLKLLLGTDRGPRGWLAAPAMLDAGLALLETGLPEPAGAQDCAVILFTSGTTAAPKGTMLRSGALVNNARAMQKVFGFASHDVALCATPLGHTGALINSMIIPMAAGGRAVVMPAWKPDEAVELIDRERATFMGAPPLILQDLVERYELSGKRQLRLSKYIGGGGAVAPRLIERADAVGIRASRNYGMTETTGTITACAAHESFERRAHFDGHALYASEVQIVDDDRRPVAAGQVGEIRIRCPLPMIGYTDAKHNEAQFDGEGWFYTGDLGRLDGDDWLVFEGRLKDIINRGGEKFSSQDIEAAIAACPGITDVAVVGAPHPRFGEVVAAFVRLNPGETWRGPESVLLHLDRAQLAKQKWPVLWHVLPEFPRTPSVKVQKQALRQMLRDG
jgi:acyl-CoA synthetase